MLYASPKHLLSRPFRVIAGRIVTPLARPVTPEVAGKSPQIPGQDRKFPQPLAPAEPTGGLLALRAERRFCRYFRRRRQQSSGIPCESAFVYAALMSRRRQQRRAKKERRRRHPQSPAIVREATRVERLAYTRTHAAKALGISRSHLQPPCPSLHRHRRDAVGHTSDPCRRARAALRRAAPASTRTKVASLTPERTARSPVA
jgi:hypothetical protein